MAKNQTIKMLYKDFPNADKSVANKANIWENMEKRFSDFGRIRTCNLRFHIYIRQD